jgi:IS5 family transposase
MLLIGETLKSAKRGDYLTEQRMERVNSDTTVQEKAIAYPTDARLYYKARVLLVRLARKHGIDLRQSYLRVGGTSSDHIRLFCQRLADNTGLAWAEEA